MNNDKDFMAVRDDMIDKYLGQTFQKDGFLYNIFSWLAKNAGIGSYFVNNAIKSRMSGMNGQQNSVANQTQVAQANPTPAPTQTPTPAPTPDQSAEIPAQTASSN